MKTTSAQYRPEIDGLRAVAILPVVFYHAGMPLLPGGFVGVDVFFVISGFLITSILLKDLRQGRFSILDFYERRARRILPVYFLVVGCVLGLGWVALPPASLQELTTSAAAATLFISNIYFWDAVNYFSSQAEFWPLIHTWSLSVEEQFYVIFPVFLMLVLPRLGQGWTRHILLGAVLLSLALGIYGSMGSPAATFYWLPTRFWEIGFGSWLALGGFPKPAQRYWREALAGLGLAMIAVGILAYQPGIPFPGWWAILPVVGTGLIIACGGDTGVARALSWRPMVFVGLISYSLYLWHWPVLVYARYAHGTVDLPILTMSGCLVLMTVLAVLSWKFVEAPFRDRSRLSRGRVFAMSGAAAALVLCVGAGGTLTQGMPQRLTEGQTALAQPIRDFRGLADCWNRAPDGQQASGLCRLGNKEAAETVLIWGDSHASALAPAWDLLLQEQGLGGGLAAHGACPPLPGVMNARADRRARSCRAFNEDVLHWLQTDGGNIRHVVLAARWALNVSGQRMEGEAGDIVRLSDNGATSKGNGDVVQASLEALVTDLMGRGLSVTLVDSVPEIGWDVPVTLLFRARLGLPFPAAPSKEATAARNAQSRQILEGIADRTGANFVSFSEELCDPRCRVIKEGKPIYGDSHHLSVFGARDVVAPMLAGRMRWQ